PVGGEPLGDGRRDIQGQLGVRSREVKEYLARDPERGHIGPGLDGGAPRALVQNRSLAEQVAGPDRAQESGTLRRVHEPDLRGAARKNVNRVSGIALVDDHLSGPEVDLLRRMRGGLQSGRRDLGEGWNVLQRLYPVLETFHHAPPERSR